MGEDELQLVSFRVSGRLYGINIMQVHQVLQAGQPVPAPGMPEPPDTVGWDILTTAGTDFVVSRLVLPTATTSGQIGVDLDGNSDGVKELSVGLQFTALPAVITP